MALKGFTLVAAVAVAVSACTPKTDQSVDRFIDSGSLASKVKWGVYVDPDGCDTWIADDGIEGYAVARLEPRTGARVCSGVLPVGEAAGHNGGRSDPI
ncbi:MULTISPECIES: hypothetical protein [Falsihalocynthiibacter]|uniref:Lipoprotein n=1 Tax=Falsihalocynthiibacter arcticus TaxID=1579316 RepID=A0A126UWB6_9RHOB|nr:hypothetical protein [Falsihalocynthiibacter arcticus]AML50340.1 hypothetical protein RC74_02830 [Falsihalocynthiibacter arcticus]